MRLWCEEGQKEVEGGGEEKKDGLMEWDEGVISFRRRTPYSLPPTEYSLLLLRIRSGTFLVVVVVVK
jgi:hypothetical protein